jgi:hypothetical protein
VQVELVNVTPDIAEMYLANNGHNRPLNRNRVSSLSAAMQSGEWKLNGETIILSETGKLLDGQHRLKAVVHYGKPVDLLVARGAPDDSFITIDTGKTRSTGDILHMTGVNDGGISAAVAKLLWQMLRRQSLQTPAPASYLIKVLDRYPSAKKWIAATAGSKVNTVTSRSCLVLACVYLEDIAQKPYDAGRFFKAVTEGANLPEGDPVLALRNRLITVRSSGGRLDSSWSWPITAKAVSYFEAGQKVSKLRYVKASGPLEVPDMFDAHFKNLTPSQRLVDLLPPERRTQK